MRKSKSGCSVGKELLRRTETHFIGTGPRKQQCQLVEKVVTQGTEVLS